MKLKSIGSKRFFRKTDRGVGAIFFFLCISLIISSFLILIIVIGIPLTFKVSKTIYNTFTNQYESVGLKQAPAEPVFKDVAVDSKYTITLSDLKRRGIIEGFSDGTVHPELTLKRGELLKLILVTQGKYPTALSYSHCFADIQDQWSAPYVCYAKKQGWISGLDNGKFFPEHALSKAEALKIFVEAFNLREKSGDNLNLFADVDINSWYRGYVKIALDNHLLEEDPVLDFFRPEQDLTRGEAFLILYKILVT